ncbi:hypothetical protein O1L55_10345 [Streptomyces albulus]|nr:hypothetical protein [Streptomyces noursei]
MAVGRARPRAHRAGPRPALRPRSMLLVDDGTVLAALDVLARRSGTPAATTPPVA